VETKARTLVDSLVRAATAEGEGLRILDRRGTETWLAWSDVYARARGVAGGLRALSVRRGERVALVYPSTAEFFDTFFGVLLAGAVPVPLYPPVRLGRLDEYLARTAGMIEAAGARLVLADRRVALLLGDAVDRARPALGCRTLDEIERRDECDPREVAANDLGLVQFSSGTTGEPRPVALSHRALLAQTDAILSFLPPPDGTHRCGVSWLPLYHDMGLIGAVLTALVRPGTLVVIPPEAFIARPATWLQAISRYRALISPAPNFAYSFCLQRIRDEEMEGVDLASWRMALNGAEQVVPDVMRAFARRFSRWGFDERALTPVYGLSEAALAVTFGEIDRPFLSLRFDRERLAAGAARESSEGRELASVGRPIPGIELRVVDATGQVVPDGTVGTIECRGPSLMDGYLGQPEATARVLREGWLNTGDLGFLSHGQLFLAGRAKDVLLLRGRKYAPEDVERAAEAVPGVRAGGVVAGTWLPEDGDTERLLVLGEARRDVPAVRYEELAKAMAAAVVNTTGLVTDRVVVLAPGTLPRTSSGKLRRHAAVQAFLAGQLGPAGRNVTATVVRSLFAYWRAWLCRRLVRGAW
jgi:acyl-CoA synthetase (AMP-forming)/AMP-acid ligase II